MSKFRYFALGISFLFLGCLTAVGAEKVKAPKVEVAKEDPLIPREILFGNPEKTSPRISPDGSLLAYLAPDSQNVLNVWVRDLTDPKSKDLMVTSDKKRGIRNFLWQFDNEHILYIQDVDGDENWHLYQTSLITFKTVDLTPFKDIQARLADYNPNYPDEILVEINDRDKALFDVYRINLNTGFSEIEEENTFNSIGWAVDNHSRVRANMSLDADGSTVIRVRDNDFAPWREFITLDPEEGAGYIVGFSPDEKEIYMLANHDKDTIHLIRFDLATGKRKVVAEDHKYDCSEVLINPITFDLEAVGVTRDRLEWIVIKDGLKSDFKKLRRMFQNNVFRIVSRDHLDENWVIGVISDQHPTAFYLYNRNKGKSEFLFKTQPTLDSYKLSEMKPISFYARDGMKLHGYLSLPVDKKSEDLPLILFVHGGPWVRDNWGFNSNVQWLTNRGYAVLQINYRGSAGYGKKYLNAGNREWGGKMHTDLLDGKQWAISHGFADPDKVAIYGGSYGGYATLVGLTFTPDEFCCGVDVVGPSNLVTLLKTFPAYWSTWTAQRNRRVGNLETEQEFLKSRSPLFKVDQIKKPLLIAQGANDPRVKQAESDQIVDAMRQKKLPVEYILFPDEGHGFARPENRLKFYAAAESFFAKYLGGSCQPPSADEAWESLKR